MILYTKVRDSWLWWGAGAAAQPSRAAPLQSHSRYVEVIRQYIANCVLRSANMQWIANRDPQIHNSLIKFEVLLLDGVNTIANRDPLLFESPWCIIFYAEKCFIERENLYIDIHSSPPNQIVHNRAPYQEHHNLGHPDNKTEVFLVSRNLFSVWKETEHSI